MDQDMWMRSSTEILPGSWGESGSLLSNKIDLLPKLFFLPLEWNIKYFVLLVLTAILLLLNHCAHFFNSTFTLSIKLWINMPMIGGRRRFRKYANFLLFYRFLRRRGQPGSSQDASKSSFYKKRSCFMSTKLNSLLQENLSAVGAKWVWRKIKWVYFGPPPPPPPPPPPMWPTPVLNHPQYPCKQPYWLVHHLREKARIRRRF